MEATEFRKGNIVLLNDNYFKVTIQSLYEGANEYFKPIPLTEEILLKCAKKYQKIFYISLTRLKAELHFEFVYEPISNKCLGIITILKSQFSDLILNEIKYLHELQNLFKELEKVELEINL